MKNIILSNGIWKFELTEQGHIVSLRSSSEELLPAQSGSPICSIRFGTPERTVHVSSARLLQQTASTAEFEATLDLGRPARLRFMFEILHPDDHGTAVRCKANLLPDGPLESDLHLEWFIPLRLPGSATRLFLPLWDGRGLGTTRAKRPASHYVCAGLGGKGEKLAIPVVDECSPDSPLRVAYFADPLFSTGITLPSDGSPEVLDCQFLSAAGPDQFPERVFGLYLHNGDADTALGGFFRHGLVDCPPGPDWLHDIAMVHYDYLSEKGDGWFRDIDKLTDLFSSADRRHIVLTLHGWYDLLGHYCFDESTGRLAEKWTVMPKGDTREMTLGEIHRRIAYAKSRGFRVLLYYADGMAIDSGAPNYSEEIVLTDSSGNLRKHHWGGPDTLSQTYVMNPLHPRVRAFFRGYTRALLDEFGGEIDGLTWDETFTIRVGDLSGGNYPGYADRAFMLLCHDLRKLVKAGNPELAFLASDCTGLLLPQEDGSYWSADPSQYALFFDGTYQDSQCYPTAWQYGIFPNYRNTLWSCNWQPVKNFEWTVLGVKAFGAPVAISNGWGEDKGISRYSEKEIEKLLSLFRLRKARHDKVRWIECRD